MKNIYVFCFFFFFTFGCDGGTIELKIPAPTPKLAIYCTFSPDRDWEIWVNSTQAFGNSDPDTWKYVENAVVEIWENSHKVAKLNHKLNNIYAAQGIKPVVGKRYTLKVSAPGYPPITAISEVPLPIPIIKTVFKDGENNGKHMGYQITFKDPAGTNNYYELHAATTPDAQPSFNQYHRIQTEDPSISGNELLGIILDNLEYRAKFSDDRFDGQTYSIDFTSDRIEAYSYFVQLDHLSKELYRYYESKRIYDLNADRPFSESSRIFSNIQGGVGIFAGYSFSNSEHYIVDELNISKISGAYHATQFNFSNNSLREDLLKNGALLNLKLNEDYTYEGTYVIPRTANPKEDSDMKGIISGSWKNIGNDIELSSFPITSFYETLTRTWKYSKNTISVGISSHFGTLDIILNK